MSAATQIEDYGRTIVAHNLPESVDPYEMLDFCDNVESEGLGSYRFDGVVASTKQQLIAKLKGQQP